MMKYIDLITSGGVSVIYMYVTMQSYMQSVQQHVPGASIGLLDQTATDTPTDGATDDSLVFMTPIAEIES